MATDCNQGGRERYSSRVLNFQQIRTYNLNSPVGSSFGSPNFKFRSFVISHNLISSFALPDARIPLFDE